MYNQKQVNAISKELQSKVMKGSATDYEIVLVIITMWRANRINEEQITSILLTAFAKDKERILKALEVVLSISNDSLIDSIVEDVEKSK